MVKKFLATSKKVRNKIKFYEKIEGWLLPEEAAALYQLIMSLPKKPTIVCEIGTWFGKSASVLGRAAVEKGDTKIYCIDPFTGVGEPASISAYKKRLDKLDKSLFEQCRRNLKDAGVLGVIHFLPFPSTEARRHFPKVQIEGLFIDGDHSYEAVMNDIQTWSSLIVQGGWMALHDVGAIHVDGPRRAVEFLKKHRPEWNEWQMIGEMAVCRRA